MTAPSGPLPPRTHLVAAVAVLAALIVFAYGPIFDNGFVWDDGANLIAARAHWDNGIDGLVWAFTRPFQGHYQPLTWLSYRVDAWLTDVSPRGVHTTNLLLHATASALVFALAMSLSQRTGDPRKTPAIAGLISAALFALHPIHVESVAWATERRDVLSTVFALAAVLIYVRGHPANSERPRSLGIVTGLHALSALSRAQMSLPFVLLALDFGPLRRVLPGESPLGALGRLAKEKRASFAVAIASAGAALWAQATAGALTSADEHGLLARIIQMGYSLAFYPAALVYRPHWLPLYERPFPFDPFELSYLVPAVLAFAALPALILTARKHPWPAFATALWCYVLLVLPVSGLTQSGIQLVADRYAYLSTIPILIVVGIASARFAHGDPRAWVRAATWLALSVLIGGYVIASRAQTGVWKDDETLWRHVLAHSGSSLADNNLGQILSARGKSGDALFHLVRSLERAPLYPRPWRSIAAILEKPWPENGPTASWVKTTIERAQATRPNETLPLYASALVSLRTGDRDLAAAKLRAVLDKDPRHEGARVALAYLDTLSPR